MARTTTPVNKDKLIAAITEAEANGPLSNHAALWVAVADIYNKTEETKISHSVVNLRVKEWNLPVKTQAGRRGRTSMTEEQKQKMHESRTSTPRKSRSEKMAKFTKTFVAWEKNFPPQYAKLIEKAKKGSMKAAIKLNCLGCCAFVAKEIAKCSCFGCGLYPFRPYQKEKKTLLSLEVVAGDANE